MVACWEWTPNNIHDGAIAQPVAFQGFQSLLSKENIYVTHTLAWLANLPLLATWSGCWKAQRKKSEHGPFLEIRMRCLNPDFELYHFNQRSLHINKYWHIAFQRCGQWDCFSLDLYLVWGLSLLQEQLMVSSSTNIQYVIHRMQHVLYCQKVCTAFI